MAGRRASSAAISIDELLQDDSVWEGTPVPSWIPDEIFGEQDKKTVLQQLFSAFQGMHELQKKELFCDVAIIVQDKTFHAHKVVLAATSKYFQAMFTSGLQECQQSEATITGDADSFTVLLDFAYSGLLDVTMVTVLSIMDMAHYLQFDYAMDRCVGFVEGEFDAQEIDVKVALEVLTRANLFGLHDLKKNCKKYLAKNFKASELFVAHMTADLMEEMLERSDLTDEKEVFDATLAWLKHDWESRKELAPSLMSKIRLGIVPIGHFSKMVSKSPNVYAVPECEVLIEKVWKLLDSKQPNGPPLHAKEPDLFASRTTVNTILCIGSTPIFYDDHKSGWVKLKKFPALPQKDCEGSIDSCCNAEGNLFVARGMYNITGKRPQFLKLDYVNNSWRVLAPMLKKREAPVLVYRKGSVYAIGGTSTTTTTYTECEVFSIRTNSWQKLPALPASNLKLSPSSCVAHNSMIVSYASSVQDVGILSDYHLHMYNPATNSWSKLTTVRHPVASSVCGLVVHGGKCYRVVGPDCKCTDGLCEWHKVNVHELLIDYTEGSASVGEPQDQTALRDSDIPLFKYRGFMINGELFVTINKHFHKIGAASSDQLQEIAGQYGGLNKLNRRCYYSTLTTTIMVDKSAWV
ncbi:kelch-like protein 38 [Amphiura filiformis]|uniref:kelch-like protein 38 n=1 Tax=Amphiura filiformis TaxID=82378 RepID=UPI003B21D781